MTLLLCVPPPPFKIKLQTSGMFGEIPGGVNADVKVHADDGNGCMDKNNDNNDDDDNNDSDDDDSSNDDNDILLHYISIPTPPFNK